VHPKAGASYYTSSLIRTGNQPYRHKGLTPLGMLQLSRLLKVRTIGQPFKILIGQMVDQAAEIGS
jgi:hypothetical protein